MNHPFSIQVLLWQHTPLIHFQHNLTVAVLRATEVKPRLDKFIIAQVEQTNGQIPLHWYVGKEKNSALDYKLRIEASQQVSNTLFTTTGPPTAKGSYFGKDKGIRWDSITLTFTSFETEVLDAIYQYVIPFFVLHNFGQRQTKGFGSFTVEKVNGIQVPGYSGRAKFGANDMEQLLRQHYPGLYKYQKAAVYPLSTIQEQYQLLKAGKNHNDYEKSILFKYFAEKFSIRWEKRRIKQAITTKHKNNQNRHSFPWPLRQTKFEPVDYNPVPGANTADNPDPKDGHYYRSYRDTHIQPNSYRYIRALLGLADTHEYMTGPVGSNNKYIVGIKHRSPDNQVPPNTQILSIERFASPILFKVFNGQIYLLPQPIDPIIFDKTFEFTVKRKRAGASAAELPAEPLFTLNTPSDFDLPGFLAYALAPDQWKRL